MHIDNLMDEKNPVKRKETFDELCRKLEAFTVLNEYPKNIQVTAERLKKALNEFDFDVNLRNPAVVREARKNIKQLSRKLDKNLARYKRNVRDANG